MFTRFTKLSRALALIAVLGLTLSISGVASASGPVSTWAFANQNLAPAAFTNFTVNCPAGEIVSGGGFNYGGPDVRIYASQPDGNGWMISAANHGNTSTWLDGYAVCLIGVNGYATSQFQTVYAQSNGAVATMSCSRGVMTQGGYGSSDKLYIDESMPTNNIWQVIGISLNNNASGETLAEGINCVHTRWGSHMTVSAVSHSVNIAAGQQITTYAVCPAGSIVVGGGFSVSHFLLVSESAPGIANDWTLSVRNIATVGNNFSIYATCASFN